MMAGLYNMVMGDGEENDRGALLLALLGNPNVARYRDAWVENHDGEPVIALYTRQGGGNRECYCDDDPCECGSPASNRALQAHDLYLRDADDDFDSTYATFYFRCPPEHRQLLRDPDIMQAPLNMSDKWRAVIDALKKAV